VPGGVFGRERVGTKCSLVLISSDTLGQVRTECTETENSMLVKDWPSQLPPTEETEKSDRFHRRERVV